MAAERKRLAARRHLATALSATDVNVTALFEDTMLLFSKELKKDEIIKIFNDSFNQTNKSELKHTTKASSASPDLPIYADRHVKRFNDLSNDYDCMEREFDLQHSSFNVTEASLVLSKCRLLVIRNFFPMELMMAYRTNFSKYLHKLHAGHFDHVNGTTTLGETGLTMPRGRNRYEVLLPAYLKNPNILANENIIQILMHKQVLGENLRVSVIGGVVVEAGTSVGYWHDDAPFVYESDSFEQYRVGGHDLPSTAVSVFFPLLNMTNEHGPTEFCVGTSHLQGLGLEPRVLNKSLVDKYPSFARMSTFMKNFATSDDDCPDNFSRVPILMMGDVVLFDYSIVHRGRANTSPDLRTMQYLTYSRPWYHEPNWLHKAENMTDFDKWTRTTRFALVEEPVMTNDDCSAVVPMEAIRNFLKPNAKEDL